MVIGLVCPLILIDPEAAVYILLGPFAVWSAVTGSADGEFYIEDMPEAGAVGLWLLLCSVFVLRELCIAARSAHPAYVRRILSEYLKRPTADGQDA